MSVYIPSMEMPESCGKCFVGDRTICKDSCPLIEVPEHSDIATPSYYELLKVAKAMHTWIFLNSIDEKEVYHEIGISDDMNAFLGYAGSFNIIRDERDGET